MRGMQMTRRYSVHSIIMLVLGLFLIGFAISCVGDGGSNLGQDPILTSDPDVENIPRVASDEGDMDIHVQHSEQSCNVCHQMHSGLMPDRDDCLVCHELPGLHKSHRPRPAHVRCHECHIAKPCWRNPTSKENCLVCHAEYVTHVPRYECNECHLGW